MALHVREGIGEVRAAIASRVRVSVSVLGTINQPFENQKGAQMGETQEQQPGVNKIKAIKTFFEAAPNGRRVTMEEMKALSPDDRAELGEMCIKALGW